MPIVPTYTDLIRAEEFKHLSTTDTSRQALINEFLTNASKNVSYSVYSDRWGRQVALLALHRLVLRDRSIAQVQSQGGTVADAFLVPMLGSVQSISGSHGSSSVSLAPVKAGKEGEADYYAQTPYGLEYYNGRRTSTVFVSSYTRICC